MHPRNRSESLHALEHVGLPNENSVHEVPIQDRLPLQELMSRCSVETKKTCVVHRKTVPRQPDTD